MTTSRRPKRNREFILRVRLAELELKRLTLYADQRQINLPEAVRDWIKSLPLEDSSTMSDARDAGNPQNVT